MSSNISSSGSSVAPESKILNSWLAVYSFFLPLDAEFLIVWHGITLSISDNFLICYYTHGVAGCQNMSIVQNLYTKYLLKGKVFLINVLEGISRT
jgi:hypothetical protein